MTVCEIVTDVTNIERQKLAGQIVRGAIAYQGKTQQQAADLAHMAKSTLGRILDGDPRVEPLKLRSIEGALGLTYELLDMVIAGDTASITQLGETDIEAGLKRAILKGLAQIENGGQTPMGSNDLAL
jgi:transcriptional regulator with XRE-family HTH domain